MYFAIIQDTEQSDNPPFAACGSTKEEVAAKICEQMYGAYNMPQHITTLEAAAAWFSGDSDDDEDGYEDGYGYNYVWWWTAEELLKS